jgi:hypothetical protein
MRSAPEVNPGQCDQSIRLILANATALQASFFATADRTVLQIKPSQKRCRNRQAHLGRQVHRGRQSCFNR